MLTYQDVFQKIEIWPVELRFLGKHGFNLWASQDDDDVLLTVEQNIILFASQQALGEFVGKSQESNLSNLPSYKILAKEAGHNANRDFFEPEASYNFDGLKELLKAGEWERWSLETCSEVLNCLNMLWDISITLGDNKVKEQLKSETTIGTLMDELTVITPEALPALAHFDAQAIAQEYEQMLKRFDLRIKVMK